MRVLIVTHIGETLGHLVRAFSIAAELRRAGCEIHFVSSREGEKLVIERDSSFAHHSVSWTWSHNSLNLQDDWGAGPIRQSAWEMAGVILRIRPDLVIGFPGVVSGFVCRYLGVPHVSVMHAPYLAPIWILKGTSPVEGRILESAKHACEIANHLASSLCSSLGLPTLSYLEFLRTERIFVPQPGITLDPSFDNILVTDFITGTIGPDIPSNWDLTGESCCYITFGSGNSCDLTILIQEAESIFDNVIVTYGNEYHDYCGLRTFATSFLDSQCVAHVATAVISHGGLGTVGTFAKHGIPQAIIPTELDQATTAVYASRAHLAEILGLDDWLRRDGFGRQMPSLEREAVHSLMLQLWESGPSVSLKADGAVIIAQALLCDQAIREEKRANRALGV